MKKVVSGDQSKTVRYVWDGSEVLAELDASGAWTRRYTPHPIHVDRLISIRDSSGASYALHVDAQGSVLMVTDASGQAVSRYRYDGFGFRTAIGTEGFQSPVAWQGRELDSETDLYYFRHRYYAPELGRFLSEDPLAATSQHATSKKRKNQYVFADNDPINGADPFGLDSCRKEPDGRIVCEPGDGNRYICEGAADIQSCKDFYKERLGIDLDKLERQFRGLGEFQRGFAPYAGEDWGAVFDAAIGWWNQNKNTVWARSAEAAHSLDIGITGACVSGAFVGTAARMAMHYPTALFCASWGVGRFAEPFIPDELPPPAGPVRRGW